MSCFSVIGCYVWNRVGRHWRNLSKPLLFRQITFFQRLKEVILREMIQ